MGKNKARRFIYRTTGSDERGEKWKHTSAALSHKGSKSLLYNANGDLKTKQHWHTSWILKKKKKHRERLKAFISIWASTQVSECAERLPDSLLADVLHGEGGVLPQLLGLLLQLAPGHDAVHRHRHQLHLDLIVRGGVVLEEQKKRFRFRNL